MQQAVNALLAGFTAPEPFVTVVRVLLVIFLVFGALDAIQTAEQDKVIQMELEELQRRDPAAVKGLLRKFGGRIPVTADVQQQAAAMRDQARQGLLTQGLNAAGMAAGPLTSAVQAEAQQDQAFSKSQSEAMQSLMLLQALKAKGAGG